MFKAWKVDVGAGEAKPCSQHDPWKHQNTVCSCLLWSQPFSYLFRFSYQLHDEWGFPRAFTHSTVISLGLGEYFKQMKTKKASHIIQCLIAFPHVSGEKRSSASSSSEWLADWIQQRLINFGMLFQPKKKLLLDGILYSSTLHLTRES